MTPANLASIAALLKARSGLIVGADKLYLLETRLAPMLRQHALRDLDALAERLRGPGSEPLIAAVVEAMTTNETLFFRDEKPFTHLRGALPALHAARGPGESLRFWSAAASTGQEAYSIAMLLAEQRAVLGGRSCEILGTDIANGPLERAREGLYTQFEVQRGLPIRMLTQNFRKEAEGWRIVAELRAMTRFRSWNLLGDLRPLGRFDVIFCRNVLIYFDPPTKGRVLAAIAAQLAPNGLLYLGGAESILGITDAICAVPGERGVYCHATRLSARPFGHAAAG